MIGIEELVLVVDQLRIQVIHSETQMVVAADQASAVSRTKTMKLTAADQMNFAWSTASDQRLSRLAVAVNGDIRCSRRGLVLVVELRWSALLTGISSGRG